MVLLLACTVLQSNLHFVLRESTTKSRTFCPMKITRYTCIYVRYTVDSRYSGSLKYGHLDIPAIWLGTRMIPFILHYP